MFYRSAAKNLQSYDHFDAGDVDFMIFTNSDNLLIQDEMLEYLHENPLHVRIKGGDHPMLQSFLVKDTEYVATVALKDFSLEMFGSFVSCMTDFMILFFYDSSTTLRTTRPVQLSILISLTV